MGSVVDTGGACETLRGRGQAHARRRAVRMKGAVSRTRRTSGGVLALAASLSLGCRVEACLPEARSPVGRDKDGGGINGKRAI